MVLIGTLFHRILPGVLQLVFPVTQIPRGLGDWHLIIHSKSNRVGHWFSGAKMAASVCVVSVLSGPMDHLQQRVQHMDARGGLLRVVQVTSKSPFYECARSLASMLVSPLATGAEIIFRHYGYDGEALAELCQLVRSGLLRMAGLLWFFLILKFSAFPFMLVKLVLNEISEDEKQFVSTLLFQLNACCIDDAFTRKVCEESERSYTPKWNSAT